MGVDSGLELGIRKGFGVELGYERQGARESSSQEVFRAGLKALALNRFPDWSSELGCCTESEAHMEVVAKKGAEASLNVRSESIFEL